MTRERRRLVRVCTDKGNETVGWRGARNKRIDEVRGQDTKVEEGSTAEMRRDEKEEKREKRERKRERERENKKKKSGGA